MTEKKTGRLERLLNFCVRHNWFGLFLFIASWAIGSLLIDAIRMVLGICECQY